MRKGPTLRAPYPILIKYRALSVVRRNCCRNCLFGSNGPVSFISEGHLVGIKALAEEIKLKKKIVISTDPSPRIIDDIHIYPVKKFLEALWQNQF